MEEWRTARDPVPGNESHASVRERRKEARPMALGSWNADECGGVALGSWNASGRLGWHPATPNGLGFRIGHHATPIGWGGPAIPFLFCFFFAFKKKIIYLFFNKFIFFLFICTYVAILLV